MSLNRQVDHIRAEYMVSRTQMTKTFSFFGQCAFGMEVVFILQTFDFADKYINNRTSKNVRISS